MFERLKMLYNVKRYYNEYDLAQPLHDVKVSIKDMYNHNTLMGIYENVWESMEYYDPHTRGYRWLKKFYGELSDFIAHRSKINIKKVMLTTVIAITLISTVWAGAHTISEDKRLRTEWEDTREVITVRVRDGDSLDKFGYQYKPTWMDIREYRELVIDLNDMRSATVYANTDLKLYVQGEE